MLFLLHPSSLQFRTSAVKMGQSERIRMTWHFLRVRPLSTKSSQILRNTQEHIQDTALVLLLVQTRSCSDFTVAPWRTTKSCPKLSALLAYSRKCILNPGNYRFEESNAAAKRQRLARAIAHNWTRTIAHNSEKDVT